MIKYGEHPPNYKTICSHFDIEDNEAVVFTYGEDVYVPSGKPLPDHVEIHEMVHVRQQTEMGAKEWWDKYLVDEEFRLAQELQAYKHQYQYAKRKNREQGFRVLLKVSKDLASEMYGNIVTQQEASKLIQGGRR